MPSFFLRDVSVVHESCKSLRIVSAISATCWSAPADISPLALAFAQHQPDAGAMN